MDTLSFGTPADGPAVTLTRITAKIPRRLSKGFRLQADGTLEAEKGGALVEGRADRVTVHGAAGMAALLEALGPDQALAHGVTPHASARLVTKAALAKMGPQAAPTVARDRAHFSYPAGPAVLAFDYDAPADGTPPLSLEAVRAAAIAAYPALEHAPQVWRASASSHIVDKRDGTVLRGERGARGHIIVADGRDITRAGEVFYGRCWLANGGRYEVSKAGRLLPRTTLDASMFQPEKLDFVGGAECEPPLEQRRPAPVVINGAAAPMDTRTALPDLTPDERVELKRRMDAAASDPALLERQRAARTAYVDARVAEVKARRPDADEAEYRRLFATAVGHFRLFGDFEIALDDGSTVTVGELLDKPDRYHGRRCRDPLEPDYRDDARVGFINLRAAGRPYIYSHAHGGQHFRLHRANASMRIVRGELEGRVRRVLEHIRLDGSLFDRGGELVRLGDDGTLYPVTAPWLEVYLAGLVRFEKWDGRSKAWEPADPPPELARHILAMRGSWGLPTLRARITAPVMTAAGRIIQDEGLDTETGLLLMRGDPDDALEIPTHPSLEEIRRAVADLWQPFAQFPYRGPVDRGVALSAILSAVQAPVLPTRPGHGFSAPAAGTGKTLLAKAIANLAGTDAPAMMAPSTVEEEVRKRLFTSLREGRAVVLLDNQVGALESPALCAALTAETYTDRILGSSESASVPNTALVLVTGNNLQVVGDLNRRILRCELDAGIERPWARAFGFDPAEYVREHRQELVRAALVVLRGYLTRGLPLLDDRTASFEVWSDTIRQTIAWIGAMRWLDVADPAEAIVAAFVDDPETAALRSFLTAWDAAHGDSWLPLSRALTPRFDDFDAEGTAPDPVDALREVALSIAGERGHINARRLGHWCRRMAGRICDGMRIERGAEGRDGAALRVSRDVRDVSKRYRETVSLTNDTSLEAA
jgi:hypothetical protein